MTTAQAVLREQHLDSSELTIRTYQRQSTWKKIQQFLPKHMRFDDQFRPTEEHWTWKEHLVHLDRFENLTAKFKVILLHGVGTNGRQISLIAGGPLWKRGFETIAIDLPGYGMTTPAPDAQVVYDDWVQLVSDYVDFEIRRDGRPIVLYGVSAGGMLAYHATLLNKKVSGIIGTTFLDQQKRVVRDRSAYNWAMSRVGGTCAGIMAKTSLADVKLPMRLTSKMHALVNNPEVLEIFFADETSAGNWSSLKFLDSFLNYKPVMQPENFTLCPILLTQPEKDRWTPLFLSELFLDQLTKVKKDIVMLENAGHYPLEQPGLQQMEDAMVDFINGLAVRKFK